MMPGNPVERRLMSQKLFSDYYLGNGIHAVGKVRIPRITLPIRPNEPTSQSVMRGGGVGSDTV